MRARALERRVPLDGVFRSDGIAFTGTNALERGTPLQGRRRAVGMVELARARVRCRIDGREAGAAESCGRFLCGGAAEAASYGGPGVPAVAATAVCFIFSPARTGTGRRFSGGG